MADSKFKAFEGMWLMSPSGAIACANVVQGKLMIPYSRSEERSLAGHFFDCQVVHKTLFARFKRFASGRTGILRLSIGENFTLKGGWWTEENIPDKVQRDITRATEAVPKMVQTDWVLMPKAKTPAWARQYFLEWPSE